MASLPAYIDEPSDQTLPGPIAFAGLTMSAFLLGADWTALNALCDSLIAAPSGGRVRFTPLAPVVVMTFTNFPVATFVDFSDRGSASERELAFGIPGVYSVYDAGGALVETAFALFMPFLFLDNPVAMITGRESYGYFKQQGALRLPTDPGSTGFKATIYGCKTFGSSPWDQVTLVTLAGASPPLEGDLGLPWPNPLAAAAKLVERILGGLDAGAPSIEVFANFLLGRIPQIFLKQFRDIADGTRACYQAITLADYAVTNIASVALEDRYAMTLETLQSAPVAAKLGLAPPAETGLGVRIVMDMTLEPGRVLWQA
jgi:hypothetical protein